MKRKSATLSKRSSAALGSLISLPTTTDLSQAAPEEPMPPKDMIDKLLEDLMVGLGFEEAQKTPLRGLPLEMKWKMIKSNKQRSDIEVCLPLTSSSFFYFFFH